MLRALYLALVAGDLVAKEIEDGTMRMALARPITRARLFWIKALANALHTCVLMWFVGATCLLAATVYCGGLGNLVVCAPQNGVFAFLPPGEGFWRYVRAMACMALTFQAISALGLMLSCFQMRPAATTVLTLSVVFVDFVLATMPCFEPYRRWFLIYHLGIWLQTFQEVVPWTEVATSLALLGGFTVTFWVVGLAAFSTRDIKS